MNKAFHSIVTAQCFFPNFYEAIEVPSHLLLHVCSEFFPRSLIFENGSADNNRLGIGRPRRIVCTINDVDLSNLSSLTLSFYMAISCD